MLLNQIPEPGIICSLVISPIFLPSPIPPKAKIRGLASILELESHSCPCRCTGLETRHFVPTAGLLPFLFSKRKLAQVFHSTEAGRQTSGLTAVQGPTDQNHWQPEDSKSYLGCQKLSLSGDFGPDTYKSRCLETEVFVKRKVYCVAD